MLKVQWHHPYLCLPVSHLIVFPCLHLTFYLNFTDGASADLQLSTTWTTPALLDDALWSYPWHWILFSCWTFILTCWKFSFYPLFNVNVTSFCEHFPISWTIINFFSSLIVTILYNITKLRLVLSFMCVWLTLSLNGKVFDSNYYILFSFLFPKLPFTV